MNTEPADAKTMFLEKFAVGAPLASWIDYLSQMKATSYLMVLNLETTMLMSVKHYYRMSRNNKSVN
jgi:hypothetical protein